MSTVDADDLKMAASRFARRGSTDHDPHAYRAEERKMNYKYTLDGKPYEHDVRSITGATVKSKVAGWDPRWTLYVEGGDYSSIYKRDRAIVDAESIDLIEQNIRMYSLPPAGFK